ncbi:MAG: sulfoxide reductase heme-binding subunit YedZ [Deltaproteobacteria bacterium]|nr:MAG: sulfoxide reductase heme-binding subunit YedZ [Deltaproteobacteria bacterium]TMB37851.1 MAG: sulfoxide reductase heme-binding subunit YedZ [Deltaproteobacteria bacterium]
MRPKGDRLLKPLVFLAAASPLLWLAGRALRGALGPDPVAEVLNRLGLYTLVLLLCSLACTPLQLVLRWKWPLRVRRMLGLFAFFYASLHLTTYVAVDQGLDLASIGKDIVKRRFVTVGFAAWCCLFPLAVTSTQGWVKRLGFRRWKALHRLAYLAGVLAIFHFVWRFKTALLEPVIAGATLFVLLAIRLIARRATAPRLGAKVSAE